MEKYELRILKFMNWFNQIKLGRYILSKRKFGRWTVSNERKGEFLVTCFAIFLHALFWLTSWHSPVWYILIMMIGFYFEPGIYKQWTLILKQSMEPSWNPFVLKVIMPITVLNYIALFACFYMLGSVHGADGELVEGAWKHFYFSAVTLTTLGYGNLTPYGFWAEFVATVQAIIGFFGFAVLTGIFASIAYRRVEINKKN